LQYAVYGGMALSVGYTVYNYIKMKKMKFSALPEDKKFLIEGIGMGVNTFNNPQFHTTIRF